MQIEKINIPDWLMKIKYNGRITPMTETYDIATTGSNCQVFAYHLLRHHELIVPDLWSSELWTDTEHSEVILKDFQPLDILFFHKREEAYGAHVAVYIGNNKAIHNSKKMEGVAIWDINTFLEKPRYQFLLGGKRFFKKTKNSF